MERNCQVQLAAMAAGDPIEVRDEYARYTFEQTGSHLAGWFSFQPLWQENLRHRPRPLRLRLTSQVQPRRVPAEGLFIVSAISQYIGAAIAISVFDQICPTIGGVAPCGRCDRCTLADRSPPARAMAWSQAPQRHVFGIATAAMNTFFYLGIARIDLGKSVAIEFIGPIAIAAFATRSLRNAIALGCAITGVLVLGGVEIGGEPAGVAFILASSACWAAYIVVGSQVAVSSNGVDGLAVGLAIGSLALVPISAHGADLCGVPRYFCSRA